MKKKVLFLQIKGKSKAGVWFVNKTIGEALINSSYDVTILSIRDNKEDVILEHDKRLKLHTINSVDNWRITRKREIRSVKSLLKYLHEHKLLRNDYKMTKKYIREYDPDYIIASHYQCLMAIPREYYSRTVHEQHSSMKDVLSVRANIETLKRYNHKIFGYIWLSKETMNHAKKLNLYNSYCLYNPVRFNTNKIASVTKNKKLICITRINNEEKRINLMIRLVDEVLKLNPSWTFSLFGSGDIDEVSMSIINNNKQMAYLGTTDNPKEELLKASINLNTSLFEGFSLSILEASMCGIPTVSFNFGESVYEEILDNETGYIIENDNYSSYVNTLNKLMNDSKKLEELSKNCQNFAKNFTIDKVIGDWRMLFDEIDKKNN